MAKSLLPMESVASPNLDLKWSLTLRVMAVALVCFLVAASLALLGSYRDVRQVNENVADIVVRQLQVQLFLIDTKIDVSARFPDWDAVGALVQSAGQCIQYLRPDGSIGRSSCVGFNRDSAIPPAWFSALGRWLLAGRVDAARPISYHGKSSGTLLVTHGAGRCSGRDLERCFGAARPYGDGRHRDLRAAIRGDQPGPPSHEGYPGRAR